jgi:hypothetical protein
MPILVNSLDLIKTLMRKVLSLLVLAITGTFLIHCGGGDAEPSAEQKVKETLTADGGEWGQNSSSTVVVDGLDVTDDLFSGFTITFGDGTYSTTGTSPVFPSSDTWTFKPNTEGKVLIRASDDKELTISSLTDSEIIFTLVWDQTTTSGGRQRSIPGPHVFTLKK